MPSKEWKDEIRFPGVTTRWIEPNYFAVGRWVNGKIVEVDRIDRRGRGEAGRPGGTYRSELTGREAKWAELIT
jgi:hypothetical protein